MADLQTDKEALLAELNSLRWFHRIDLGDGLVTPGEDIAAADKLEFNSVPTDLTGRTVLDIGAWDGLFSFEAERRGATRVLATDSFAWDGGGWGTKACFDLAHRILGSNVESRVVDVMDLSPESVGGTFDVVLCLGVLYHLRHPLLALERVASVAGDLLILSTLIDIVDTSRPAAAFYPGTDLNDDETNWWGPNPACVKAMLHDVGFPRVEMVSNLASGASLRSDPEAGLRTAAFHAWR
jgi:tRNA (mo5U34)-methyltransferase